MEHIGLACNICKRGGSTSPRFRLYKVRVCLKIYQLQLFGDFTSTHDVDAVVEAVKSRLNGHTRLHKASVD